MSAPARPRLATWYFEPTRTGWRLVLIGNKDPTAPIQDAELYEAIVPSFAAAVSAWLSVQREGLAA